jgi:hypothetical protein
MRRLVLAIFALFLLPACFGPTPLSGPQLESALVGRTVAYRAADPQRNVPPLYQSWNADGSLHVDRSPVLRPERVWQDRRWWWVDGARYCETDDVAARGQDVRSGRCNRVYLTDRGTRLVFEAERADLVSGLMFPRIVWSGRYVAGRP